MVTALQITWNATASLIGIIIVTMLLDEAGFFRWGALHVLRLTRGNGKAAFVATVIFGAMVSTLFTNDGAVLVLTPLVYEMVVAMGVGRSKPAVLAFAMAAGFIVDSVSTPLVTSNLVNILNADYFGLSFGQYAARMALPALVSLGTSLGALWWYFRKDIPRRYEAELLPSPAGAVRDRRVFSAALPVLFGLVVAFTASGLVTLPVSVPIAVAAAVLAWRARGSATVRLRRVLLHAPWQVVLFSLGMYLVVFALRNSGLISLAAGWLARVSDGSLLRGIAATGLGAASLSAVMNNLPATVTMMLTVDTVQGVGGPLKEALVLANIIGSDLGPKMTPLGSLATLLWLHILKARGITVSWQYYVKVGVVLTVPVLTATLVALWVVYAL